MANWIIVVAGGRGTRMNMGFNRSPRSKDRGSLIFAQNKIFAKLGKLPIIYWTLGAFEKSKAVDKVLILAVSSDIPRIKRLVSRYKFKKTVEIIPAGESRQASTLAALEAVKDKVAGSDLVGVHNGVNPFVTQAELTEVFKSAKKHGAALLAQAARDTVKITGRDGLVKETPLRQNCWYAQTPQVATFANMYKAHMAAKAAGFAGTDDSQLLERVGVKPKIVSCSNLNFKITFREDLVAANYIIKTWIG